MLAYDATRVYAGFDRIDEALGRIAGVAERFRSIQAFSEAAHAELLRGELLLRADRPEEAEPLLRAVLAGAPTGSPIAASAAWLLSESLLALGREAEADALRTEYGLEPPSQ
jgi:hypothetical protein